MPTHTALDTLTPKPLSQRREGGKPSPAVPGGLNPIEIFRPGSHTAMSGATLTFSEADLSATAAAYDPSVHEAPIVVGHPRTDAPAYGWVSALRYDDTAHRLTASPSEVNPAFAELVKAGAYKKVSASFYSPTAPGNPAPGVFYLRHVGFLGAMAPAVKGLKDASFADAEEGVIEFSAWDDKLNADLWRRLREWIIGKFGAEEADTVVPLYDVQTLELSAERELAEPKNEAASDAMNPTPAFSEALNPGVHPMPDQTDALAEREAKLAQREAELQKQEQAALRKGLADFAEQLVQQGRVLPVDRDGLVEFMASLDGDATLEFGEGTEHRTTGTRVWLEDFLKRLPVQVDFSERSAGSGADTVDFADPLAIVAAANRYQAEMAAAGNPVDDIAAVQHVTKNRS